MTEAAPGSAGAGNPAGAAAAAAATAATTTAATTTAAAATPQWTDGFSEDALVFVESKGWKNPAGMLESYQGLEKHVGRDPSTLLVLPGADASDDEIGELYGKLGRPEKADGYQPAELKGADEATDAALRAHGHELGLNQRQFDRMRQRSYEGAAAGAGARSEQLATDLATARRQLETDWGGAFKERDELAGKALAYLGIDRQAAYKGGLLGGENGVKLMVRLAEFGESLSEDRIHGGGGGGFGKTALQAKAEIGELMTEQAFLTAYQNRDHVGHQEAVARMARLQETAYGTGAASHGTSAAA